MSTFLISFLPDFVFHLIVLIGIIGVVASNFFGFIPFISAYKTPIQVISIVALAFGIYFEGGIATQEVWEARVAEAEKAVLAKQVEGAQANTKIQYVYIEKTKAIQEAKKSSLNDVAKNAAAMDAKCVIIPEVNNILNAAAKQKGAAK